MKFEVTDSFERDKVLANQVLPALERVLNIDQEGCVDLRFMANGDGTGTIEVVPDPPMSDHCITFHFETSLSRETVREFANEIAANVRETHLMEGESFDLMDVNW